MKTLDESKIFTVSGPFNSKMAASDRDGLVIGYKGVGEAIIPRSLEADLLRFPAPNYSPKEILELAVIHSQYVPFEEIPTP